MKCRIDMRRQVTKQVAQNEAGQENARSDTMLNTHGQQERYER